MRKLTMFVSLTLVLILCSSFSGVELTFNENIAQDSERKMLDDIEYIEAPEEHILGFDTYFYLPSGFNAYKGMELDLNDIEYIEL